MWLLLFIILFGIGVSPAGFAAPQSSTPSRDVSILPKVETYDQLVHAIREARAASQKRLDQAIHQEKVREAWETGKLIDTHVLHHTERADYGEQVLKRLAADLGTSHTELKYMLQFSRAYPISPPADQLSWAHYRELLSLNDPAEREAVRKEAVRQGWSRDQVRTEVRKRQAAKKPTEEKAPELRLTARPGTVGVYRVIRAKAGPFQGELGLDLGFANYYQPKEIKKFKEGDIVQWNPGVGAGLRARPSQGAHRGAPLQKLPNATEKDRYTYQAYVTQVIDGDTFKAVIDLGFHIVTEQKLRLRGLDAPEIESAEGREAKGFLERRLTKTGSPVLIRTVKSDKYDRYLADVWIDGNYINQLLIDKELAVRVSE